MKKRKTNYKIIPFSKKYANDFAKLNFEWLEKYFYIEDYDRMILTNPKKYIIDLGGYIFFVKINDKIIGTLALIKRENGSFELSKMAVTENFKRKKIGLNLMLHCIDFARNNNFKYLFLDSNSKLTPAINLYKKVGFVEIPTPENSPYERCNIRMKFKLI